MNKLQDSMVFAEQITGNGGADSHIGAIIQKKFALSKEQVDAVLEFQRQNRVKFGEAAVALGYIRSEDVIWALSQQFHYPYQSNQGVDEISEDLIVAGAPFSEQAEFFRDIRSDLLMAAFSNPGVNRSLAVTSADSGEGKTYFATNLAIAFAQLGARTLLIDADMRSPRVQEIFKIDSAIGLSAFLAERAQPEVLRPVASIPTLFVMPVGVKPPNPTELIQRPSFSFLLDELQGKFDYIIVDTPALIYGMDALMVAARCGASVALSRRNVTRQALLEALVGKLSKTPTRFAGVVLNSY